jgi:hypothetical protein
MALKGVEMIGPVAAVMVDPVVDRDQPVGAQRLDPALGVGTNLDEPDFAQHTQVA